MARARAQARDDRNLLFEGSGTIRALEGALSPSLPSVCRFAAPSSLSAAPTARYLDTNSATLNIFLPFKFEVPPLAPGAYLTKFYFLQFLQIGP